MAKKVALPRLIAGAGTALALVMFLSAQLHAVSLTITADAVCDGTTGNYFITYNLVVDGPYQGVPNPSVNVLFDNVVVDNDAIVGPTWGFGDTLPAPAGKGAGDTVNVSLLVVGTWDNGFAGGQTAETDVVLPPDCDPPTIGGCTPGYWKAPQHFDSWVDPYDPDDLFNDLPGFADAFPGLTLLDVLSLNGGGLNALGRHTVAAILNSAGGFGVDLGALATAFNNAIASGDYEPLKDILDILNNLGCPLD